MPYQPRQPSAAVPLASLAPKARASLAPTYRYYDPFGNPVGTPPSSWPGTRGFVGGTADQATGLTNLGARQYNPATGSFISPDPELQPGKPQDLDAYAQDDPASDADPSGLMVPGQSYRVNPGPGLPPAPAPAHQPGIQSDYTFAGGGTCGICGSSSYGLAFQKSFAPSATPPRTRAPHLLFPGMAAIAPACAAMAMAQIACVPTVVPVAPAVRRPPMPKLTPDELQGLAIILALSPIGDILDLGIDAAAAADAAGDAGSPGDAGAASRGAADDAPAAAASGSGKEGGGATNVFRVEGPGNARLNISPSGGVSIKGNRVLFLNFGQEARAQQFLELRLSQGFEGTQIKTFQVQNSFLEQLRGSAVDEAEARAFPDSPFSVDTSKAPDQFGLRAGQFDDLLANVVPGSGG